MKQRGTRFLPLVAIGYECIGGPLNGSTVFLTERSTTSAYIEWGGYIGRYIYHDSKRSRDTLRWEHIRFPDSSRFE